MWDRIGIFQKIGSSAVGWVGSEETEIFISPMQQKLL